MAEWMLAALNIILVVSIIRIYRRYRIEKERLFEKTRKFDEVSTLVFHNAVFMDAKGIAQGDYDRSEVQRKWDLFHRTTNEFYKI